MATLKVKNSDIINTLNTGDVSEGLQNAMAANDGSLVGYQNVYANISNQGGYMMNEFISTLLNRIGLVFIDNLREYKNPMQDFIRDDLVYGDTMEEIALKLAESHRYDTGIANDDPAKAFKQEVPELVSKLHNINYQNYFERTINDTVMKRAFINEYGLSRLISGIITVLVSSANNELFQVLKGTLTDAYKYGDMVQLQVADPTQSVDNAKALAKVMRKTYKDMQFMKSEFNTAELETFSVPENIYTFIDTDTESNLDVDVLAYAYNKDKADILGQVRVVDGFNGTGIKAIMLDRDAMVFYQTKFVTTSIFDPLHLATNLFLHSHGVYSFSTFLNSIAFTTDKVNVAGVTKVEVVAQTNQDITKGGTKQCTATVTGDSGNEVYWRLIGNTSNSTYVNEKGVVYCSLDEKAKTLTIEAYAKQNSHISGKTVLNVK